MHSVRSVQTTTMVGTCSLFYLFCTVLIFFSSDSVVLSDPGNEPQEHTREHTAVGNGALHFEETEKYQLFDRMSYSYIIQFKELRKDTLLQPPIIYNVSDKYHFLLEPISITEHESILKKISTVVVENKLYIKIDEDLTDIINNNDMIVLLYKLKAVNKFNSNVIEYATVRIKAVKFLLISDTVLEFEEHSYSIKLSYGRKGKVFRFNVLKTALLATENDKDSKNLDSDKRFSKINYAFRGNYSLEYVPELLLSKLKVTKDGDLVIIGNIDEGFYNFDIVAVDFGPESSTILKTKSMVYLFVDNVAVCSSKVSNYIKAFSKYFITEETELQIAVPATETSNLNCTFAISHQYPLGVGDDFFIVHPSTGAVNVVKPIDREAYPFEDMEEPSVYLKLKIHCPPPAEPIAIQPFNLHDVDSITYDPTTTLIQLVIVDTNDNPPVFPDKHIIVGYPVLDVADTIKPKHLVQVKAMDKDAGKYGKIQYSLRGNDANGFVINPETGTIYCTRLVDDSNTNITFEVVAKDNDGKPPSLESVLSITVKYLTYSDIIRVNVNFSMIEDCIAIETQLSDISGVRVISLDNDVINTFADGHWRMERTLTVYGVNYSDGSLVSGLDLEKKLINNAKILEISNYLTKCDDETGGSTMSVLYTVIFFLMLSMIAVSLLYFGYVKNGRYLSCILSTSTTPLKDDMENMSQSNWITTFNRSNLSSARVRFSGNVDSPVCRSKIVDHATCTSTAAENSLYKAIPPKRNASADNSLMIKLDSKLSFEDDLIKSGRTDEAFTPTDDRSFIDY